MSTADRDAGPADGRAGPPAHPAARSRGAAWRRALIAGVVAVALLAAAAGAAVTGVFWYGAGQVARVDVGDLRQAGDTDGDGVVDVEELTEVVNVLVVGSDSRAGLTDEQLVALGTDREDSSRTDTIMLVQLDPRRDQASVLSFPRDLLVTRCDGSRGKINAAYAIGERVGTGGPTCLVRTVADLTGVGVNHFVEVDFAGFIEIVDALGGVRLHLDEPIVDPYAGLDLPAGCVELDGKAALGFVRTRRIDNDFGRIARQQRFIREIVAEAVSVGTLVNVPRLLSIVDAVGRMVEADRDLSAAQMRRIAMSLRNLDVDGLDMRTVPGTARAIDGVWYVEHDEDEADVLFAAFREGRLAPGDVGTREVEAADAELGLDANGHGSQPAGAGELGSPAPAAPGAASPSPAPDTPAGEPPATPTFVGATPSEGRC